MPHLMTRSIIVVDDDRDFLNFFESWFNKNSFNEKLDLLSFDCSLSLKEHLHNCDLDSVAMVILDIRLDDENGLRIGKDLKNQYGDLKIIHISSLDGDEIIENEMVILSKNINKRNLSSVYLKDTLKNIIG